MLQSEIKIDIILELYIMSLAKKQHLKSDCVNIYPHCLKKKLSWYNQLPSELDKWSSSSCKDPKDLNKIRPNPYRPQSLLENVSEQSGKGLKMA